MLQRADPNILSSSCCLHCTVNDGLRIRQVLETTYHLNCLLHIIHPARWPIIEKYIQSQDFAWLGVPQLSSTLAGFLLGRILGQQFSSSSTDGCSLMWIVSSRFVNVVSPPNARCSFLLLLLLHMTYDERDDMCTTISGSGYRTSALPNLNCKNTKAIEGFQGSKKKSMDAKHFIRYVYMSIWL